MKTLFISIHLTLQDISQHNLTTTIIWYFCVCHSGDILVIGYCQKLRKYIFLTARLAAPEVADLDLAESVLSSTYWGREDDLDSEYSLFPNKMPT